MIATSRPEIRAGPRPGACPGLDALPSLDSPAATGRHYPPPSEPWGVGHSTAWIRSAFAWRLRASVRLSPPACERVRAKKGPKCLEPPERKSNFGESVYTKEVGENQREREVRHEASRQR